MDRIHKLFWECYIRNCEIEKEEVNNDDLEAIKRMDRDKLYKHFRLFIGGLLEFKNQVRNSESTELAQRNMQFESIITKLEADIRAHIAKHYQLRLEIETQKNTIEELNSALANGKNQIKDLKTKSAQLEKTLETYKTRLESKRNSTDNKRNYCIDTIDLNQIDLKSSKSTTKILTERSRPNNHPHLGKQILAASKSYKTRIVHNRCKSEFSKSLKILIP